MVSGAWCNDCKQCLTEGCYDSCGMVGAGDIILFLIVLAVVAAVMGCAAAGACCYTTRRGFTATDVLKRGIGLAALCAAGFALLWTEFTYWHEAPGSEVLAPCSKSRHRIGMSWSGDKNNADYFASCPDTVAPLNAMRVLISIAIVATAAAFLLTIALKPLWPSAVAGLLASIFTAAALGVHGTSVVGNNNFCGSGRSLADLGYRSQSGLDAAWCGFAFVVVGGLIHPAVLHALKIGPSAARRAAEYAPVVAGAPPPHSSEGGVHAL